MKFGYHDTTASEKPTSFSLFWKGMIADEDHYEPHLSEEKEFSSLKEITERIVPTRGATGEDVNLPMVPLLPTIKRRKDNHLAMFLEGNTIHNKTLFTRNGVLGAKYGEGIDSSVSILSKWKETNKTKN